MERSNLNIRIHDRDIKRTKSTFQRPENEEGNFEFEALSRRLCIKNKPYDPEEVTSSHRLTDNRFSSYRNGPYDTEEVPYSHQLSNLTDNRFSTYRTKPYYPEEVRSSPCLSYSTDNRFSTYRTKPYNPEEVPSSRPLSSSANNCFSAYQNLTNDKRYFEYEALSGRQSIKTERYDSEEISTSHRLASSIDNRVPTYQRPANDEGNFGFEALSGRKSVKTERYDSEEISTSHRLASSIDNHVSTYQIPANDESNFGFETLSGKQFVKTERHDSEEISTSHPLPYLIDNHFSTISENVVIPTVGPPPIMIKISSNFEADLKLIIEKFGQLSRKKVGIFIKFCPETYDMHCKLISFFEANNIQYNTPRKIRVYITGLPCHMRTQQIKDALTEKGFEVEEIIQVTEHHTNQPLPLFQVVLPNSDGNQNILYLTNLLNLNISVGSMRSGKLRRHYIKCRKKVMVKSEAGVPIRVNFCKTPETISWDGSENYGSNNNFRQPEITHANMSRTKRRRNRRYFH